MPNLTTRRHRASGAHVLAAAAALATGMVLGMVLGLLPVPAVAASAVAVPAQVGQAYGTTVTIQGHGFGHGEGMGQYGAYGYATRGWSWQQILGHFYGGTSLSSANPGTILSVRLQALDDRPFTTIVQDKALLYTNVDGGVGRYRSLTAVETAQGVYAVYGRADAMVCPNAAAAFDSSGWTLLHGAFPSSTTSGRYLDVDTTHPDQATADPTNLLGVCQPDGSVTSYRGALRVVNGSAGENRTVNFVPLDLYVRGVVPREMPASWGNVAGGMHALRAQAVAARSFALSGGNRWTYAKICDTQSCQVYGGAARRASTAAPVALIEAATATAATAETAGVVLVRGGAVVSAMYSSSTGGITAGVVFPSVVDEGDSVSPHHTWSVNVAVATIEAKWPAVGRLQSIDVVRRNGRGEWGGRVLELVLRGSAGTQRLTGDQLRIGLGLKSNWFYVPDGCAGRSGGTPAPAPAPVAFTAVAPARVVDTRVGLNAPSGRVAGGCVLPVRLAGQGGIPETGATAAVVNLTAVNPAGGGYATLYPCAGGRPEVSALNFAGGDVVANLATVQLDGDGYVCLFVTGASDVLLDVMGWYGGSTADRFRALAPVRLRDTRREAGGSGPVAAGGVLSVPVAAAAPAGSTVRAVALNLTVTRAAAGGYVTAYPCDGAAPPTSNANFPPGRTTANQVVVAVGAAGTVCLRSSALTDLVVDLQGWYGPAAGAPGTLFTPLPPARLLDTRNAVGVPGRTVVPAGATVTLAVAGRGGVAAGASAVAMNVTAPDARGEGYVTVAPCGRPLPLASNLNPGPGRITANQVMVGLGGGSACLFTSGPGHLLADVAGYFA